MESHPFCVEGTLVCWRDDSLLLDSDTVVLTPDGSLFRLGHQDGMTAVLFEDIKSAAL